MIHVVARSVETGERFVNNHPTLAGEITVELGTRSYFELINRVISESSNPYICLVHDDVFLPRDFDNKVHQLVERLNQERPNWGIAGNAAIGSLRVGYSASEVVRYISDPHGGPNLSGTILPVQSIDGNVMLLNVAALHKKAVRLPSFDGFHLYDIVLSYQTLAAGLGVFVCPQLSCWHGSKGNQADFDKAKSTDSFNSYLLATVRNSRIATLNGSKDISVSAASQLFRPGIDVDLDSLRAGSSEAAKKTVAIVTRTQFTRPDLLERTLDSVQAFIAAAGNASRFESIVITDKPKREADEVLARRDDVKLITTELEQGIDTRFLLVKCAAETVDADYFWFIDDDDWLFPNEAERLALSINSVPAESLILVDCQHFTEVPILDAAGVAVSWRSSPAKYFPGDDFMANLTGSNHIPFCGQLFPRQVLLAISDAAYQSVTYYEDYMTGLLALMSGGRLPVVVDKLMVGISVREVGNTITETDRTRWNRSMANLVSELVNDPAAVQLHSLPRHLLGGANSGSRGDLEREIAVRDDLISAMLSSTSWRLTRPIRGVMKLLRGHIGVRDLLKRF